VGLGVSEQAPLFGPHLARSLANKDQALRRLEERYAGFLLVMREEARKVVARAGRVTTDDLRAIAKIRGLEEVDPHAWGGIFKELDAAGQPVWRSSGRTASNLPSNNGRLIQLWVLR
jgi:hypothetical protein